jgi:hypothetical protein
MGHEAVPTLKTILCPYCLAFFFPLLESLSIFFSFQLHTKLCAKLLIFVFLFFSDSHNKNVITRPMLLDLLLLLLLMGGLGDK